MTNDDNRVNDLLDLERGDYDEPRLVDGETLDRIESIFSEVLAANHDLPNPQEMPLSAMAAQVDADGNVADALANARQHPETGGAGEDVTDADEPETVADALENVDSELRRETRLLLSKARTHDRNDRLPGHASRLRADAADLLDVDLDDLEAAFDRDEIDVPSDPKQLLK